MKYILLTAIVLGFGIRPSYAQESWLSFLGKPESTVLQHYRNKGISPCEQPTNEIITYCVEDGSRFSFLIERGTVYGISSATACSSRLNAEHALDDLTEQLKSETKITPFHQNGMTLFSLPGKSMTLAVKQSSGTYYLMQMILVD